MMSRAMMSSGGFLPTRRSPPGASMSTSIFRSSSDPCIGNPFQENALSATETHGNHGSCNSENAVFPDHKINSCCPTQLTMFGQLRVLPCDSVAKLSTSCASPRFRRERPVVQRAVVVDYDDRIDAVAGGGFELPQMIIETAVAREADHGRVRQRAFHAERARKRPCPPWRSASRAASAARRRRG